MESPGQEWAAFRLGKRVKECRKPYVTNLVSRYKG